MSSAHNLMHWNDATSPETLADERSGSSAELDGADVEDLLLRRAVKARMFDRADPVQIGRYDIERKIGSGGMGTVFAAVDPELGRRVAIKLMRPGRTHADRMQGEARALARLAHPNVVTVHEVGRHRERVFLAMEYIEGQTLDAWLAAPRSLAERLDAFAQAAAGLHAAHLAGLVHRDFKPANVLIGEDGRAQVIDFGIAKWGGTLGEESASDEPTTSGTQPPVLPPQLTRTGQFVGTPMYMACEQFLGGPVDARTDVFCFAVALCEALQGERPFAGDNPAAIFEAVREEKHASLRTSSIPRALRGPLTAALRRDPDARPSSMTPLIAAIKRARNPRRPAALVVGGLALAGLSAGAFALRAPAGRETESVAEVSTVERESASQEAFARLLDTEGDGERGQAAAAFLKAWEAKATVAQQMIATAWVGLDQWRRACPTQWHGLCARLVVRADDGTHCDDAKGPALLPVTRDSELSDRGQKSLREAWKLAQRAGLPTDSRERAAFSEALGDTMLAQADEELESLLSFERPDGLDFEGDGEALSREAFTAHFALVLATAKRLANQYAAIRGTSPRATIAAASRVVVTMRALEWDLLAFDIPPSIREHPARRQEYCDGFSTQLEGSNEVAVQAFAFCETRLAELPEPSDDLNDICLAFESL